jgi:hypothetical protein
VVDVVGRQPVDPEQMAVRERGLGGALVHEPGTIGSGPSCYNRHRRTPTKCWRASAPRSDLEAEQTSQPKRISESGAMAEDSGFAQAEEAARPDTASITQAAVVSGSNPDRLANLIKGLDVRS